MFLSFFLELGLFGLALFCGLFILVARLVSGMADRYARYYCAWLLLFVVFASLTYWHTRTLWFSISLIVFARHGRNVPIPFGPYLAAAGLIALLWGKSISQNYLGLFFQ